MKMSVSYYVTTRSSRWRGYVVVHQSLGVDERKRAALRYTVVSRHFTWKGAQKVARRLNITEGRTA